MATKCDFAILKKIIKKCVVQQKMLYSLCKDVVRGLLLLMEVVLLLGVIGGDGGVCPRLKRSDSSEEDRPESLETEILSSIRSGERADEGITLLLEF